MGRKKIEMQGLVPSARLTSQWRAGDEIFYHIFYFYPYFMPTALY